MKKVMVTSLIIATIVFGCSMERGHRTYVKHSKHHKVQKAHKPHGKVDATYN